MQPLGELLPKRMNKLGLQKALHAARIVSEANRLSQGRFEAISFSRGTLAISCTCSTIAQELQFSEQEIINNLNARLDQNLVQRIRFQIRG